MARLTLYFVRHGETYLNKYVRMQGWSNAPLTPEGIEGCLASGRGLAHIQFDYIYTSDLQRTKDTAQLILSQNKVTTNRTLIEKVAFREVFFGQFEGLPALEIWEKATKYLESKGLAIDSENRMNALHALDDYHDAENYTQFWERIERGLLQVLNQHQQIDQTILIVSHGMAINLLLHGLVADYKPQLLHNASVSKVIYEQGQFRLEYANDISHFIYK